MKYLYVSLACCLAACGAKSPVSTVAAAPITSHGIFGLGFEGGGSRALAIGQVGSWTVGQAQEFAQMFSAQQAIKIDGITLPAGVKNTPLVEAPSTMTLSDLWQSLGVNTNLSEAAFSAGLDDMLKRSVSQGSSFKLTTVDYAVQANLLASIAMAWVKAAQPATSLALSNGDNFNLAYNNVAGVLSGSSSCPNGWSQAAGPTPRGMKSKPGYLSHESSVYGYSGAERYQYTNRSVTTIDTLHMPSANQARACQLSFSGGVKVTIYNYLINPHYQAIAAVSAPGFQDNDAVAGAMWAFHDAQFKTDTSESWQAPAEPASDDSIQSLGTRSALGG